MYTCSSGSLSSTGAASKAGSAVLGGFFEALRAGGVPVSLREWLQLLEGMQAGLCSYQVDDFYLLARLILVKDERHYDRFDRVFATVFRGVQHLDGDDPVLAGPLPEAWLRSLGERFLSEEEKAAIATLGGFDQLLAALRQRLAEQQARHEGGSKWIGTRGTSPFGADGYHPEGVRIGQAGGRHHRAVKVWERRDFRDLAADEALGPRNLKVALRRLRRMAREGPAEQLDLSGTLRATADNAGWLALRFQPEWRNRMKVLLFLDVGGSMDAHVQACADLFAAARGEFRHLQHFYFHNFLYESVWTSNQRRHTERTTLWDIFHRFGRDWRVIVVGDAHMAPYEIMEPGGSVEHWNEEAGRVWFARLCSHFPHHVWLNPIPREEWAYGPSIRITERLLDGRMEPLTLDGIDRAARLLG